MDLSNIKIKDLEYGFEIQTEKENNPKLFLSAKINGTTLWKTNFAILLTKEMDALAKHKVNNKIFLPKINEYVFSSLLLHEMNNKLYCVINGYIFMLNISDGKIKKIHLLGNTSVENIIFEENKIYALMYYKGFDIKSYCSNILCLYGDLEIKWKAELPKNDVYTYLSIRDNNLIGNTWNCFQCIINKDTGKIMDKIFTK